MEVKKSKGGSGQTIGGVLKRLQIQCGAILTIKTDTMSDYEVDSSWEYINIDNAGVSESKV